MFVLPVIYHSLLCEECWGLDACLFKQRSMHATGLGCTNSFTDTLPCETPDKVCLCLIPGPAVLEN